MPDSTGYQLAKVKRDMAPINTKVPYSPTPAILEYFNYYNLNPEKTDHYFGTLESEGYTLATHVFAPSNPKGTLVLIHGYFDHTGTLANLIHEGISRNYCIVVWDLPGHGLSTGERTSTDGFDLCARQLVDIIPRTSAVAPQPMYVVAHSTGCSIAIEYMIHTEAQEIDGYVFLAPLIRHTHWGWAKFGYGLAKPFKSTVRRRDKLNSSDAAYLAFAKQDPLHSDELSFNYLDELYRWERRVQDYAPLPGKTLILQGDKDDIVDWKYNIEFIEAKITNAEIQIIPNARHQLVNENPDIRVLVFDSIFQYLENKVSLSND